jgi:hypothetical protein
VDILVELRRKGLFGNRNEEEFKRSGTKYKETWEFGESSKRSTITYQKRHRLFIQLHGLLRQSG